VIRPLLWRPGRQEHFRIERNPPSSRRRSLVRECLQNRKDGPMNASYRVSTAAVVLRKLRLLAMTALVISAMPLLAMRTYVVGNDVAERLAHGPAPGQKLVLDQVPLIDGNPMTLELERFEVWA